MCWSLPVSIAFASFELVCLSFLAWRCCIRSPTDPTVAHQRYVLPLLVSIFLIEAIEAGIWADGDNIAAIGDAMHSTCTARNRHLTRFAGVVVFWQPFIVVFACRHTGDVKNRDLLRIPQHLALVTAVFLVAALAAGEMFEHHIHSIKSSHYLGMHGLSTCSYVGLHGAHGHLSCRAGVRAASSRAPHTPPMRTHAGHLHWVWKMSASYMMPNAYPYFLLGVACLWARPLMLVSGAVAFYLVVFTAVLFSFDTSMEAASVWCWTAVGLHLFFIAQPYLLRVIQDQADGIKYQADSSVPAITNATPSHPDDDASSRVHQPHQHAPPAMIPMVTPMVPVAEIEAVV